MHNGTERPDREFCGQVGEGGSSPNPPIAASCSFSTPMRAHQQSPRLVIEADCTTCGPIGDEAADGISIVRIALAHSAATAHVVILNGTTDLPDPDRPLSFR